MVSVRWRRSTDVGPVRESRAGVSVAKKQVKLATQRNRLKRQVRSILAAVLPGLPRGSSVVVRVLSGAKSLTPEELGFELRRLVKTASTREQRGDGA